MPFGSLIAPGACRQKVQVQGVDGEKKITVQGNHTRNKSENRRIAVNIKRPPPLNQLDVNEFVLISKTSRSRGCLTHHPTRVYIWGD